MRHGRTTSLVRRLTRLEALASALETPAQPHVQVWVPANGREVLGPGRYRCPGANAEVVIYAAPAAPMSPALEASRPKECR